MSKTVSKSGFKPHALEYFRQVEETGEDIVITNHGIPVLKVVPYRKDKNEDLKPLRNSVLKYDNPFEPVDIEEWEALTRFIQTLLTA